MDYQNLYNILFQITKLGKKNTEEHKQNISKARIGKFTGKENPFFGKTHSEESKEKMSKSQTGKKHSVEQCLKKSIAFTGEKHPNCSITEVTATEIKIRLANGESIVKLKTEYGTTRDVIANIKYEKSWKHIKI